MGDRSEAAVIASIAQGIVSRRIPLVCAERFDKDPLWMLGERTVVDELVCRLPPEPEAKYLEFTVNQQGVPYGVLPTGEPFIGATVMKGAKIRFVATKPGAGGTSEKILMLGNRENGSPFVLDHNEHLEADWVTKAGILQGEEWRVVGDGIVDTVGNYITHSYKLGTGMANDIVEPDSGPPIITQFILDDGRDTGLKRVQVPSNDGFDFVSIGIDTDWPLMADRLGNTVALLTRDRDRQDQRRVRLFDKSGIIVESERFTYKQSVSPPVVLGDRHVAIRIDDDLCVFGYGTRYVVGGCLSDPTRMGNGDIVYRHRNGDPRLAVITPGSGRIRVAGSLPDARVLDHEWMARRQGNDIAFVTYDGATKKEVGWTGTAVRTFKRTERGFRAVIIDATLGRDVLVDFWNGKSRQLKAQWDAVDIEQCAFVGDRMVGVGKFGDRWHVVDSQGKLGKPADSIHRLRYEDGMLRWDMRRNDFVFSCLARAIKD